MGNGHDGSSDGAARAYENPYDVSNFPAVSCQFCSWLLIALWPIPFMVLGRLIAGTLPDNQPDLESLAGWLYLLAMVVFMVICMVVPGVFIAKKLLRGVCSKQRRTAFDGRGSGAVQRASDWWWGRHPFALFLAIIFLGAFLMVSAETLILDAWVDALRSLPGFDALRPIVTWPIKCLSWLGAGLGLYAVTAPFLKATAG